MPMSIWTMSTGGDEDQDYTAVTSDLGDLSHPTSGRLGRNYFHSAFQLSNVMFFPNESLLSLGDRGDQKILNSRKPSMILY